MQYNRIKKGIFHARPNRFIAHVEVDGRMEVCHVKNTGRCRELLQPGATVYLEESDNPARKTRYDLVTVEKGERIINMDSQAPNKLFAEWAGGGKFRPDLEVLRGETTYGNSRFDFYWKAGGREGFVEVKGVTLEEDGVVRFPDAPTLRGVKHIEELIRARQEGYEATICFVIQMDRVKYLSPNDVTHLEFGHALRKAKQAGVEILALDCKVIPGHVEMGDPVEVRL